MFKFIEAYFLPQTRRRDTPSASSIQATKAVEPWLSEERFSVVAQAYRMGIWEVDVETQEVFWDQNMFQLLNVGPLNSSEIKDFWKTITPPEEAEKLFRKVYSLKEGESFEHRYSVQLPDRVMHLHTVGSGIVDANGKLKRIIGINRDVTAEVEAQNALEVERTKLLTASKMASLGEMASNIAHEINNPLAIIMTRAHQLRMGIRNKESSLTALEEYINKIESTVMRISKIIKSLRTFAHDSSYEPFKPASLGKIFEDTLEICGLRFSLANIELQLEIPGNLNLDCRASQLSQVFMNLLSNSYDAVLSHDVRKITVKAIDADSFIEIYFSDSGPEIPPHVRQKLMVPFFTTKPVGFGTGLGLTISRNIVENHHGEIKLLESEPQTTFFIRLPKKQADMNQYGESTSAVP